MLQDLLSFWGKWAADRVAEAIEGVEGFLAGSVGVRDKHVVVVDFACGDHFELV